MRMEAVAKDGRKVVLKYAHEDLEVCVGIATAAFVVATLRGDVSAMLRCAPSLPGFARQTLRTTTTVQDCSRGDESPGCSATAFLGCESKA